MMLEKRSIRTLIISRLIIVTTLAVAAIVIQLSTNSFLPLEPFYLIILILYGLTLFYLALYRWNTRLRFQANLQIVFDLIIISIMVYVSGGLNSNMYFLYVFAIVAASLVIGTRPAYLTASLAAIFFGVLADGMYYGLIPYFRSEPPPALSAGYVLYTVFTAWTLFFVIALLVNYLAVNLNRTRAALAAARRDLEIKERQAVAGRMSALIAHEIRNPLAAISGSIQVLKGELTLTEEQGRLMDIVVGESRRVSQSIDQFLNLAAPGKDVVMSFDLGEISRETATMLRMSGELTDRVAFSVRPDGPPVEFFGSPNQLKQVFWNLFRNALRAMPDGGALTVDLGRDGRGTVEVRVTDTGKGMSAEEQARMFEPFYSKFEGGQGLGMSVVERIVADYGGQIRIASEPSRGTVISLTFPARPGDKPRKE
jgi:two-component system sensor histidine kinase PilS (NtrC family)